MKDTWIRQALNAGGKLTVESVLTNKAIYRAEMKWPGLKPIRSDVKLELVTALEDLDNKLMEDAADEMIKAGAV